MVSIVGDIRWDGRKLVARAARSGVHARDNLAMDEAHASGAKVSQEQNGLADRRLDDVRDNIRQAYEWKLLEK